MPLVGHALFMANFTAYRTVWIRGGMGKGKSLVGVAILDELLRQKLITGCVYNIKCALKPQPFQEPYVDHYGRERPHRGIHGAGILFDEAGRFVDNRTFARNNLAYGRDARKLDVYMVMPSVTPVDKRLAYLSVERVNDIQIPGIKSFIELLCLIPFVKRLLGPIAWLGQGMWKYKWSLSLGEQSGVGTFWLMSPGDYYPLYDTYAQPSGDGDIAEMWIRTSADDEKYNLEATNWYVYEDELSEQEHAELFGKEAGSRSLVESYAAVRASAQRVSGGQGIGGVEAEGAGD